MTNIELTALARVSIDKLLKLQQANAPAALVESERQVLMEHLDGLEIDTELVKIVRTIRAIMATE